MNAITEIIIPGVKKMYGGKVRDLYKIDKEHMLIVSTDRVSAFDYVFPNGIPEKGKILNTIANIWFKNIDIIKNHVVEDNYKNFPKPFCDFPEFFEDRAILVKRTKRIDYECVARGYIIGSGWKDYQKTASVCGIKLRSGLQMAEQLDDTIFTPATKEDSGHDMNVSIDTMRKALGIEIADKLGMLTIRLYDWAREHLDSAGIILADTKIEFGFHDNEIILIDEIFTPDSSRFWDKSLYNVGQSPISYDKQFIRDYIETTKWDKNSPPPPLPDDIITKTREKYLEILNTIESIFSIK